jgi:hypothetical protein
VVQTVSFADIAHVMGSVGKLSIGSVEDFDNHIIDLLKGNRTIPMTVFVSPCLRMNGDVGWVCAGENLLKELVAKEPNGFGRVWEADVAR